jgi:predicted ABC-type ATPase
MPGKPKDKPVVFMIGGPNGAGKTTSALRLLPKFLDTYEFVNADEIARGLNPLNPESARLSAGRVMLERISQLTAARKNFAFESTCAGTGHVAMLKSCRASGYQIHVVFYWLPTADMAVHRVRLRVRQGGHDVPEETIRRRYASGLRNLFQIYLPLADRALILDNTRTPLGGEVEAIAEKTPHGLNIADPVKWLKLSSRHSRSD